MSRRSYSCVFKRKFKNFGVGSCTCLKGGFARFLLFKDAVTVLDRYSNTEDTVKSNILFYVTKMLGYIKALDNVAIKCRSNQVGLLYETINLNRFLQSLKTLYDIDLDGTAISCKLNDGVAIKLFGTYYAEFSYNGVVQHRVSVNVVSN